jgi:hypothetical protein
MKYVLVDRYEHVYYSLTLKQDVMCLSECRVDTNDSSIDRDGICRVLHSFRKCSCFQRVMKRLVIHVRQ